jgi:hypothetical protein
MFSARARTGRYVSLNFGIAAAPGASSALVVQIVVPSGCVMVVLAVAMVMILRASSPQQMEIAYKIQSSYCVRDASPWSPGPMQHLEKYHDWENAFKIGKWSGKTKIAIISSKNQFRPQF